MQVRNSGKLLSSRDSSHFPSSCLCAAAVLGSVLSFDLTVFRSEVQLLNFLINFCWSELEGTRSRGRFQDRADEESVRGPHPCWLWQVFPTLLIQSSVCLSEQLAAFPSCLSSVLVRKRSSGSFSFPKREASGLRNALCFFPSVHKDQCPRMVLLPSALPCTASPSAAGRVCLVLVTRPCPHHQRSLPLLAQRPLFWCGRRKAPVLWPDQKRMCKIALVLFLCAV